MTSHGFRSTASTILNEYGYRPDVIEAALGHQNENIVRRAYNRATYWPERVELMQKWADMLDTFRMLDARTIRPEPVANTRQASACPLSSAHTIPTIPTAHRTPECRPRVYIGWHIRWQKPFPPPGGHNTLIPRQFA